MKLNPLSCRAVGGLGLVFLLDAAIDGEVDRLEVDFLL